MNEATNTIHLKQLYYRIIALWVICESLVGGIIHGFKLPISGLLVGSCSVICICLIAFYIPDKGAIIKATILVAIFKMMLSPHSPPMAYIAVFFQGILGEILFYNRKRLTVNCMVFSVLALAESALQRIFVLWLIYGENFWIAVNKSIEKIFPFASGKNYILFLAVGYTIIHCIAGIIVAMLVLRIKNAQQQGKNNPYLIELTTTNTYNFDTVNKRKKKRFNIPFFILWIVLTALLLQSTFKIGSPVLPETSILFIFIRAAIILLTWYFVISPLISKMMKKWLEKEKTKSQTEIQDILELLPSTRFLISQSWLLSKPAKGFKRLILTAKIIIANTLTLRHA